MEYLKVKNWESFQHYKDREPPWIKLHRTLLTDYEFACLQDASKLHLMLIWLLASQSQNKIPNDPGYIKNALHLGQSPDLKVLIEHGFLEVEQDASKPLADRKQVAMLEAEAEAEAETDIRSNAVAFADFWVKWPRKVKRKEAERAWNRLTIKNQKLAMADFPVRYAGADPNFIPHPTTYIHGERWNDEIKISVEPTYGAGGI